MSDDRLDLVRKLLAKAEGTTNEAERDTYNAKAAELIAKYGIDQALLANDGQVRDEVGDRIITLEAPYLLDKASLLTSVAKPLRVRTVRRTSTRTSQTLEVHLFGFAADLDRVEILFTSLLMQATFGLASVRPDWAWSSNQTVAAYRRTWLAGFSSVIYNRLLAAEKRATADADADRKDGQPGTALVLAGRDQAVATRVSEAYPKLTTGRGRTLSGGGYQDGRRAGQRADLGQARVSGRTRSTALAR